MAQGRQEPDWPSLTLTLVSRGGSQLPYGEAQSTGNQARKPSVRQPPGKRILPAIRRMGLEADPSAAEFS